ncbi:ORF6N domain-containing protein [Salmonella enterica subsp. enterica serovar Eastbourne]|uniref:ORF6N domain-containing protein n=1 Tax=Salmonella enterica subsp. enterica serovar Eastbourne TaxID=486993 RepID=A0A702F8R8_SALET|nr:ORF6N domain-containing protein [Salmonella enterica subsp. enterica serovar Eastbourne]ECA1897613.1 ORF6N domain-containing protein [Salmonella enterica subsp. enterica serovar Eastbourne]HAC6678297.1 ORF6N domain-containing protein [Salmonella enterica subsp. enterica serovar Eastbourne]HAE5115776.1 ORF6N domain-containing protein [Salmonella enterica subsp. enterica serovar Eastbourne]HAE8030259.1 ORF6N domain-containing protein [Salmonella enterica subsp. enterica serovar Eastbourne]
MAMKTELVPVAACNLQIIEYRGQRVVTNEQLAAGYGTDVANIKMNYSRNADRFVEGKHFFKVTGEELTNLRVTFSYLQISSKTRSLMLWTERGAANHAKMLETDQAWSYHEDLVEFYFTQRDAIVVPVQRELSTMEILQIAMASEQSRLAAEERAKHAERTKSQISRKREASALGKLSAITRRCRDLEDRLGENEKHATITKVEKATNGKGEFKFAPLRRWCRDNAIEAKDVPDERYGSVKSWPAGAWLAVYGIDLKSLFGKAK